MQSGTQEINEYDHPMMTPKGGGTEKRGGKTKILKRRGERGKLHQGGGVPLKRGLEPPYKLWACKCHTCAFDMD